MLSQEYGSELHGVSDDRVEQSIQVRQEGTSIVVRRGESWLCRARARVQRLPALNLGFSGQLLILDEFAAPQHHVLQSEHHGALPVLRDLLRSVKTNSQRPWHVLRVDARIDQDAVVGAAWRFALEWDMACEVRWGGDVVMSVFLYGHGVRAAVARTASHLAGAPRMVKLLRQRMTSAVRSRRSRPRGAAIFLGLDLNTVTPGAEVAGVAFRRVDLATVSRRPRLYGDTILGAEEPLERGEECYVGEIGGRTIFRMWIGALQPEWIAGMDANLAGMRSRYVHESHTLPEYRNRGINSAALRWIAAHLRDQGCEMLWLHVRPDNAPALRSFEKVGFRRMGT